MNKQLLSILSVVISILLALAAWLYFNRIDEKRINPAQVLPDNMVLAIELNQSHQKLLNLDDPTFMHRLLQNDALKAGYQELLFIDSLLQENSVIGNWFNKGKAVYSLHTFENGTVGFLLGVQTLEEIDSENALDFFQKHFPGRFKMSKRKLISETLYDFTDFKTNQTFTVAFKNKLMFFSPDGSLVELAILKLNKLNYDKPQEDQLGFVKSNLEGMYFHINYENLRKFLKYQVNPELGLEMNLLAKFAERSVYEVKLDDEDMMLKGAALTHATQFQYLDLMNAQAPIPNTLVNDLPIGLNFAITLGFNGYANWHKNVNEYLLSNKYYNTYKTYVDSIENALQIKFSEKLAANFGNHAALLSFDEPGLWKDSSYVVAIELNDVNAASSLFREMDIAHRKRNAQDSTKQTLDSLFYIKHCHLGDAMKFYFTDLVDGISASRYVIHHNYLYLANNAAILSVLESRWKNEQLQSKQANFSAFQERLSPQSNIEMLLFNEHTPKYLLNYVTRHWFSKIHQNMGTLKRAQFTGIQFAGSNDKVFATQIYTRFNLSKAQRDEQVWAIQLDTGLAIRPAVVFHSQFATNVILVQDYKHKLYLIDREGKILWNKVLDSKILSEIKEIELYNNSEKQFVFNTSHQLFIINCKGNSISGWPVWIPTGTNYPVSIIEPNQDRNYQFFLTGIYFKVSGFNAQGRLISGWNPRDVWPNLKGSMSLIKFKGEQLLAALNEKGQISYFRLNGTAYTEIAGDSNTTWFEANIMQQDTGSFKIVARDSMGLYAYVVSSSKPIKFEKLESPIIKEHKMTIKPIGNYSYGNLFKEADNWLIFADETNKLNLYHLK